MITALTLIETILIGLAFGVSTMAVVSYILVAKYGYPSSGLAYRLIQLQYSILRFIHVILGVIIAVNLVIFGLFDAVPEALQEYAVKAILIIIAMVLAICMSRKMISVTFGAPIIAAGWHTLAIYNTTVITIGLLTIPATLLLYIVLVVVMVTLFQLADYCHGRFT